MLEIGNSLEEKLQSLEASVASLIERCEKLSSENSALRRSNHELLKDRSVLQDKNDKTKSKVEGMISRLKAMENNSSQRGAYDQ